MIPPINDGEKALAILGMYKVIDREIERWTLDKQREFDKFQDEIQELADKCVAGKLPLKPLKKYGKYDSLLERIKQPLTDEDIAHMQFKFADPKDELAAQFIVYVQNVWNHLSEIFPVSEYRTFMGPQNLTPTGDKTWEFFSKLLVLNDPRNVYMLISSGAMLKSWSQTIQEFYPTLSKAITETLYAALTKRRAEAEEKKVAFMIPPGTSFGLSNWLGRRSVDYDPNPEKASPAQNNPGSAPSPGVTSSLSPSERVTQGATK